MPLAPPDSSPRIEEAPLPLTDALAEAAALLHAEAFPDEPWDLSALLSLSAMPGARLLVTGEERLEGFVLLRQAGDEAEVIAIAVAPPCRRRGLARALLAEGFTRLTRTGVVQVFLEVAEDNAPARALYGTLGFRPAGRRRAYYRRAAGPRVDALVLVRALNPQ